MDHARQSSDRRRPAATPRPNPAKPINSKPLRPTTDAARDRAYRHLSAIAGRLPDLDPHPLADDGLSPRDAAFAHAIADAGLRRWLTLAYLLQGCLSKPFPELEPNLRGVLIGGASQILLLDKVPIHAAINESVEWAKSAIRPGAGAMVNAVLRKLSGLVAPETGPRAKWSDRRDELLLADGTARPLSRADLPDDPGQRFAVLTSHQQPLADTWAARFGPDVARRLQLHSLVNPPTVLYIGACADPSRLPPALLPHTSPAHRVFTGARAELQDLLARHTDIWVQDAASSDAVAAAAHLRPRLIADLCAGQGTKTRQLAATFPQARIVATDTDADRLRTLRGVFAGSSQVETMPSQDVPARCKGTVDLILLDVPCSNTGVLARRAEAKYRWGPRQLERLTAIQKTIIEQAQLLLAPEGRILYSTCSLEPEENHQLATRAAERFGLVIEKTSLRLPEGLPGDPPDTYSDGAYHALLARAK